MGKAECASPLGEYFKLGHLPTKVRKVSLVESGRLISFGQGHASVSERALDGLTLIKIGISAKAQGPKGMRRLICVVKPAQEGPSETRSQFFLREPTRIFGGAKSPDTHRFS
jgi:hypothetical protein